MLTFFVRMLIRVQLRLLQAYRNAMDHGLYSIHFLRLALIYECYLGWIVNLSLPYRPYLTALPTGTDENWGQPYYRLHIKAYMKTISKLKARIKNELSFAYSSDCFAKIRYCLNLILFIIRFSLFCVFLKVIQYCLPSLFLYFDGILILGIEGYQYKCQTVFAFEYDLYFAAIIKGVSNLLVLCHFVVCCTEIEAEAAIPGFHARNIFAAYSHVVCCAGAVP